MKGIIKNIWQIMTLLLAVATVLLSTNSLFNQSPNSSVEKTEETVSKAQIAQDNIMTRSSVRKYTTEKVSDELVEQMLRAGMAAPTAGNRQPWEFYVVRDTSIIKQMNKVTKFAAPMNEIAQLAIVVCGVPSESFPIEPRYWVQDVSAATENILLSAHAWGLGAVWCGVYPGEERVAVLRSLLDIPEKLVPFNIIMIGHLDKTIEPQIKDKWKPEKVHYK